MFDCFYLKKQVRKWKQKAIIMRFKMEKKETDPESKDGISSQKSMKMEGFSLKAIADA